MVGGVLSYSVYSFFWVLNVLLLLLCFFFLFKVRVDNLFELLYLFLLSFFIGLGFCGFNGLELLEIIWNWRVSLNCYCYNWIVILDFWVEGVIVKDSVLFYYCFFIFFVGMIVNGFINLFLLILEKRF